jgi:hypothetical protein
MSGGSMFTCRRAKIATIACMWLVLLAGAILTTLIGAPA